MNATLMILALTLGGGCDEPCPHLMKQPHTHTLGAVLGRKLGYYVRVYYGVYDRPQYDYRTRFDYPWCSGPSRYHWPIPAPPSPPEDVLGYVDEEPLPGSFQRELIEQGIVPAETYELPPTPLPPPQARRLPRIEAKEVGRATNSADSTTVKIIKKSENPLR